MSSTITLVPSGHTFNVEKDESVLDAALREGIALPYGCRNGTCLSCRGKVLSGEFDYRGEMPKSLLAQPPGDGWDLLCQAVPKGNLTVEIDAISLGSGIEIRTLPCRVIEKKLAAHDVIVLTLKLPEGEMLQYLPGQYVDIRMRDGRRRSFSVANPPQPDDLLTLHIRHLPDGAFSSYVFNHLKEKALLRIRGPLGGFFLRDDPERGLIFLAGGTGFAPVKSIIQAALKHLDQREMHLYWGVRAKRDLYMHELALDWAHSHSNFHYVPVLSEPRPEDHWQQRVGFVHEAVLDDFPDLSRYQVYSSGPPVMIDAAWATFAAQGLEPAHHFSDAFEFAYETGADTI